MNLRFWQMPKEDAALVAPFILSMSGDHEITLSPCRRVLLYEDTCIRIETVGCTVEIRGSALTLSAFHGEEIQVKGLILSLGIERSV